MKKMYEIKRITFGDVCSDSWYGKELRTHQSYVVFEEESDVVNLVDELNKKNHSTFPVTDDEIRELRERYDNEQDAEEKEYIKYEIEDLFDRDEDYWTYSEYNLYSIEKIRKREWLDR